MKNEVSGLAFNLMTVQKMAIWDDFQGLTGVTRRGRGVKKLENCGDVIHGWSLSKTSSDLIKLQD